MTHIHFLTNPGYLIDCLNESQLYRFPNKSSLYFFSPSSLKKSHTVAFFALIQSDFAIFVILLGCTRPEFTSDLRDLLLASSF